MTTTYKNRNYRNAATSLTPSINWGIVWGLGTMGAFLVVSIALSL